MSLISKQTNFSYVIKDKDGKPVMIGKGGFGSVYRAKDISNDLNVAIKVVQSAQNEIGLMLKIPDHDYIVTLLDSWSEIAFLKNDFYLVMHLAEGDLEYMVGELYNENERKGYQQKREDLRKYANMLIQGVKHLHEHNILHRDLKPGNVLMFVKDSDIVLKITDFGASKEMLNTKHARSLSGTISYMAPEMLEENPVYSFAVDIWSLGLVLYYLFTGNKMFKDGTARGNSIEWTDIESKRVFENDLSVRSMVERMVRLDPEERKLIVDGSGVRVPGVQGVARKREGVSRTDSVPVCPPTLTVSSDQGPAGEKQWILMGEYTRSDEDHVNKPVWTNWDGSQKMYYHAGSARWVIGTDYTSGGIRSAITSLQSPMDVGEGWEYHTSATDVWTGDTMLTVTANSPQYPETVRVSSNGPAGRIYPSSMGLFTKQEKRMEGKPVWRKENDQYYFFYSQGRWLISDDYTGIMWIQSARESTLIPTMFKYHDGTKFIVDNSININKE